MPVTNFQVKKINFVDRKGEQTKSTNPMQQSTTNLSHVKSQKLSVSPINTQSRQVEQRVV